MAQKRAINIDTTGLALIALAGFGVWYFMRPGGLWDSLVNSAAAANYRAANAVTDLLWGPAPLPYGSGNPQGFPPPASSPYYADWLTQAAGYPGVQATIAPGARTQVGQIFDQFGNPQ
jgi:hypothetical protein